MDQYIAQVRSQLRLCEQTLQERAKRLEKEPVGMSRHYSKLAHTSLLLAMVWELQGVASKDPDCWDEEEDQVPF